MSTEILIIDDNADIRNILNDLISDAGYKTRIAANYNQALKEIDKKLPDIAIIDVKLDKGDNDGIELLSHIKQSGIVAACGNASSIKLNTTVMPFIIRGVKLWGIDSVNASIKRRESIWGEAAKLIDFDKLEKSIKEISLEELIDVYPNMLAGKTSGRYIVNVNK